MPRTRVVLFQEDDGTVPLLAWLDQVPDRVRAKCRVRMERLAELGHELRRPEADYLRGGVYELRLRYRSVNYRILYFFHQRQAVVLSHGLAKQAAVPPRDIELAIDRLTRYRADPGRHTYSERQ